jgi:cyclopropane-fatty-acyl-phospholipid synthase
MSVIETLSKAAERAPLPDFATRAGISWLVARTRRRLASRPVLDSDFAALMAKRPIAEHAEAANAQHYEVPAAFFALTLGPRRKYSCCYYENGARSLAEAEKSALEITVRRADLRDGQRILELGCGWGSLSLFMAERLPAARITAVSNSSSQRGYIQRQAAQRGLSNLEVVTADMNDFMAEGLFDRVVSIEMFEHMANWRALLSRVQAWLAPEGRVFIHIFTHRASAYRFDLDDKADWIAQHFFTGGVMPSHGLMRQFADIFAIEEEWRWSGANYERTALDWLVNFDAAGDDMRRVLADVYGAEAELWGRRWRLFFLATAGLFGDSGGAEWGVSHYRLKAAR